MDESINSAAIICISVALRDRPSPFLLAFLSFCDASQFLVGLLINYRLYLFLRAYHGVWLPPFLSPSADWVNWLGDYHTHLIKLSYHFCFLLMCRIIWLKNGRSSIRPLKSITPHITIPIIRTKLSNGCCCCCCEW